MRDLQGKKIQVVEKSSWRIGPLLREPLKLVCMYRSFIANINNHTKGERHTQTHSWLIRARRNTPSHL
jgi:hypothetical protein